MFIEFLEGLVGDAQPRRLCYTGYAVSGDSGVRDSSAALGMTGGVWFVVKINRTRDG